MPDIALVEPRRSGEFVLSSMMENAAMLAHAVDPLATLSGRLKRLATAETEARSAGDTAAPHRLRIRILVEDEGACYRVVFVVHQRFAHDPDAYRDYLRAPKANGYRSIHTTVFDDQQQPIELRVRTRAPHDAGRHGAAVRRPLAPRRISTTSLASAAMPNGQPVPSSIQRAIVEMAAARESGDRVLGRLVAAALVGAGRDVAVLIEEDVGATHHSLDFPPVLPADPRRIAVLRLAVASQAEAVTTRARVQTALQTACIAAEEIGADDVAWRCVLLPADSPHGSAGRPGP